MQFPIDQFELYIHEAILKRGLSYFKKGLVSDPEEITAGVYEAVVAGTDDYIVKLKIKNNMLVEHVCSCPYDMGSFCKHIAAVLFYLQQDELGIKPKANSRNASKGKSISGNEKKKPVLVQVTEILEKITEDQLKLFILETVEQNIPFRNIFLSAFAHQNTKESKGNYSKQIKSILRAAAGRDRFISWNKVRSVGNQVAELMDTAQKHFENENFKSTIFICCAVLEEMTEALQFADDSNGDIGGNITLAFDLLFTVAQEKLPEEIRTQLFDYCLSSFGKKIYDGWDWQLGVLDIAVEMLINDSEAQRILDSLARGQYSEYEIERVQRLELTIIKKTKGEKEAEKFIEQHLSNPIFRREAIQKAILEKAYEKAIKISKDGIKQDSKSKPGLAMEWYDWLLKIAQSQKDKEKIIEYARFLFIDHFRSEQDYYQLLKNTVQPELWNAFVEGMIKDISAQKRWLDTDLIAKIYIAEGWWSRLLELVQQKPSLVYIEHFEKYLSKDFSNELILLYGNEIVKYVADNIGRNHYQTACKYFRRMIKLGGRELVENIVSDLRKQYPQRKALMEELENI